MQNASMACQKAGMITLVLYGGRVAKNEAPKDRGDEGQLVLVIGHPGHHRTSPLLQAAADCTNGAKNRRILPLQNHAKLSGLLLAESPM